MAKPRRIDGIGAPVKRREDFRLLTGQGRYAEDWNAPEQAHAAFVRSPHAHADVVSIDAKPALALEDVLGVFTGRDLVADGVGPIPTTSAALAEWDAGAGRYTLYAGLQSVHQLAANLARVLGVTVERVRCVTADVGGGFGSKIQVYPEYVALAWAARRLGRAVKWASTRSEGFVSDVQSRDHLLRGELALDAAGRVTALRVHSTPNLGAYVAPSIPISTLSNMERMIS